MIVPPQELDEITRRR